ncbi:MAG TPA: cytochrome c maturation protein CcmE [Acidimicrobiales bacterium]|jgi:cytochrome c-type biogenesis protein CcmE|nr:cytochrome c maturation protein CcmE [Acidimicrobiales bacterium]
MTSTRRVGVAIVVILAALGFLVFKGLGNATVFFRTADEAVHQKASLGTRRFRVEGVVVDGTVAQQGNAVRFDIANNGSTVHVVHQGDPPELFKPNIPVVLEGRWAGDHYASDRIMVKHTEDYRVENPDRVKDYPTSTTTP